MVDSSAEGGGGGLRRDLKALQTKIGNCWAS